MISLQVKQALQARGNILILYGGGITGDLQVNDTHMHRPLKTQYRHMESDLMLQKLSKDPGN